MSESPILAIVTSADEIEPTNAIVASLGYQSATIVQGGPLDAAGYIVQNGYSPKYIILFIGSRTQDIIPEIDALAENCESDTRVVVIGQTNDITFYRTLKDRGVVEYFNYPVPVDQIRQVLFVRKNAQGKQGKIVSVISGSSGDGASTVAMNTAYILAKEHNKKVVLVDLDYQFGMIARQLELTPSYGIKEIFDHPERGVDSTLITRMAVPYREGMDVIASPQSLYFMPHVKSETIRDFVGLLSEEYDYVVLDIPNLWSNWVSACLTSSNRIVLVAQLLLKSITHSSRMLRTWSDMDFDSKDIEMIINRSGSRFKESVHPKDFERICAREIGFYFPNDIKTIVKSENRGTPLLDIGASQLVNELSKFAQHIIDTDKKA
jgi:pilus assembly protein CpaE